MSGGQVLGVRAANAPCAVARSPRGHLGLLLLHSHRSELICCETFCFFKSNLSQWVAVVAEMLSGEEGSYLRLIDLCTTQL